MPTGSAIPATSGGTSAVERSVVATSSLPRLPVEPPAPVQADGEVGEKGEGGEGPIRNDDDKTHWAVFEVIAKLNQAVVCRPKAIVYLWRDRRESLLDRKRGVRKTFF